MFELTVCNRTRLTELTEEKVNEKMKVQQDLVGPKEMKARLQWLDMQLPRALRPARRWLDMEVEQKERGNHARDMEDLIHRDLVELLMVCPSSAHALGP